VFDRQLKQAISGHMARANEHMARGNEHMARANDHMARSNELMKRNSELMGEVRHEIELSRRDRADMVVFIRDMTTRSERHSQATVRAIDANTTTLTEMRADMAANRTAILSVIDRLEPPPEG
jgi:predicted transcriptional regulator